MPIGASKLTPVVSEEQSERSPGPYWPRLARAVLLLGFAVSLHIWGVRSPYPQETPFAVQFISQLLTPPPVPLAPPLQIVARPRAQRGDRDLTLQTLIVRVTEQPPLPPAPLPQPAPTLLAVATTGSIPLRATDAVDAEPIVKSSLVADKPAEMVKAVEGTKEEAPIEHRPAAALAPLAPASTPPPALSASVREPARSAAATTALADRRRAEARDAAEQERREREQVLALLREYARGYERIDVRAIKAVYPSVDGRRLERAFHDLQGTEMRFASCGVSFSDAGGANARCKGNATFVPKVGSKVLRYTDQEWMFSLAREGGGWQILNARMQQ